MAAPSEAWTVITAGQVDADSPINETLMGAIRKNLIHLEEWLGDGYTAVKDHDHDDVNSKAVTGVADGVITGAKMANYAAGSLSIVNNNTEQSTSSTVYVKLKETVIDRGGALRIDFQLKKAAGQAISVGKIYVNGEAHESAIERSNDTAIYINYSQDLSGFEAGDAVQIYGRIPGAGTAFVNNFTIKVANTFHPRAIT